MLVWVAEGWDEGQVPIPKFRAALQEHILNHPQIVNGHEGCLATQALSESWHL